MRLYKITALNTSDTPKGETPDSDISWVGSQTDAAAKRKQLTADGWIRKEIETEEIDVPTDKAGLMAFLNKMRNAP